MKLIAIESISQSSNHFSKWVINEKQRWEQWGEKDWLKRHLYLTCHKGDIIVVVMSLEVEWFFANCNGAWVPSLAALSPLTSNWTKRNLPHFSAPLLRRFLCPARQTWLSCPLHASREHQNNSSPPLLCCTFHSYYPQLDLDPVFFLHLIRLGLGSMSLT